MHQPPLTEILDFMLRQARSAGAIMRRYYQGDFKVFTKPDHSKVTEVDLAISDMVRRETALAFPEIGLYSEESPARKFIPGKDFFIIDELDGTSYFIEKKKGFSHQAAFYRAGAGLQIGLVYLPIDDILIYAVRGEGAFIQQDGKTNRIEPPPAKPFDRLIYGHPARYRGDKYLNVLQQIGVDPHRIVYTTAYKTLQFVRGELDVSFFLKPGMPVWDWAGDRVIIEELGFAYTHLNGTPLEFGVKPSFRERGFLAAPKTHQEHLIRLLEEIHW